MTEKIRILTVCTGNICRSPYAELLLQDGLDTLAPGEFEVASAGVMGLKHQGVEPPLDERLRQRGIDPADFESRPLTRDLLRMSDVLLPLTIEHRGEILSRNPASLKRTFTLLELASVCELLVQDPPRDFSAMSARQRWESLLELAGRYRRILVRDNYPTDVEDPYRKKSQVFTRVAETIEEAVEKILGFERAAREGGRRADGRREASA